MNKIAGIKDRMDYFLLPVASFNFAGIKLV